MEATIRLDQPLSVSESVNWMPFGIAHDGPCNAAEYFAPTQEQGSAQGSSDSSSSTHFAAHFRGRRLKGTPQQLPEGYQGLLLKPCGGAKQGGSSSSSDTQQRSWQALHSFQQMTVWNHDLVPASSDWHMRCIDFLALADKVGAIKQTLAPAAALAATCSGM
ncbi:ribonuclease H2 non-catalytic subunit-domain-containing protein [Scenedesmus sp. NREL 46B-D3]|nr:ribonuclease H2 non-catalytic subunit-domain-containing protein [Scenedesmus sp. NREL 46B-D3]